MEGFRTFNRLQDFFVYFRSTFSHGGMGDQQEEKIKKRTRKKIERNLIHQLFSQKAYFFNFALLKFLTLFFVIAFLQNVSTYCAFFFLVFLIPVNCLVYRKYKRKNEIS